MTFPTRIQAVLDKYDEKQAGLEAEFVAEQEAQSEIENCHDEQAIEAVKELPESDQNNLWKIYHCFRSNLPEGLKKPGPAYKALPLTEQLFRVIREELGSLSGGVRTLYDSGYLTQETFDILSNLMKKQETSFDRWKRQETSTSIAEKMASIIQYSCGLTPEVIDLLTAYPDLGDLESAILNLSTHGVELTPEVAKAIKAHTNHARTTSSILVKLKSLDLLTVQNINALTQHPSTSLYTPTMSLLTSGLLNQDNFNQLLVKEHAFLCSHRARSIFWDKILLNRPLTQNEFNQLLQIAREPAPEQHIRQYLNVLIKTKPDILNINDQQLNPTPHQHIVQYLTWLDNQQSTYIATMHQSVPEPATVTFPLKIQTVLDKYDGKQAWLETEFDAAQEAPTELERSLDKKVIEAVKKLPESDRDTLWKIYQCCRDSLPEELKQVYKGRGLKQTAPKLPVTEQLLKAIEEELGTLSRGVCELCTWGHLTQENFNTLSYIMNKQKTSGTSKDIAQTMLYIQDFYELTPEIIDLLATYPDLNNIKQVISNLLRDKIKITPEIASAIKAHTDANQTAQIFFDLKSQNILTVQNINTLAQHPCNSLLTPIHILFEARLLNQENFNQLFAKEHSFLCSELAMMILWQHIPHRLLTQDIFNQLLQIASQRNPEQNIARYLDNLLGIDLNISGINDQQSTHTASVHQSVSESAKKLSQRYQIENLEETISDIETYIGALPDDSLKNQAAKRCIERLTAPSYDFIEPVSQISTRQLLALAYLAIKDQGNCTAPLEEAKALFVEGLYEIQRGYNLSESGKDQGGGDRPICIAGTFNKIVEKLQGIHPDCQVNFITQKTLFLKLPIVVREEAIHYLSEMANKEEIIAKIKTDGIDAIWGQIKEKICKRIFDEFGSLFKGETDPDFLSIIDFGKDVTLSDADFLKPQGKGSQAQTVFFAAPRLERDEQQAEPTVAPRPGR